ncbi:MAG: hypothetical protein PHQ88_07430 [Bacteroides sp.]|nr:hypothetical protein [Bacteroides sp.]MDD4720670.1 hypothetical protein [Bacteroides sp.]
MNNKKNPHRVFILLLMIFLLGISGVVQAKEFVYEGEANELTLVEWIKKAEGHVVNGEDREASVCYHQVLLLDEENLSANIFLGNYYYVQAEEARKVLESEYARLAKPTRMEYAKYKDSLKDLWPKYIKASVYLKAVLTQFPSDEVMKTLKHIEELHKVIE